MNSNTVLLHSLTAICTGALCLGLHPLACGLGRSPRAHPEAAPSFTVAETPPTASPRITPRTTIDRDASPLPDSPLPAPLNHAPANPLPDTEEETSSRFAATEEPPAWHPSVEEESDALRQLPTGFDDDTLAAVASVRREFAARFDASEASAEDRTALRQERTRRLEELLGPDRFDRLARAEDPRYGPFAEMVAELQLPQEWADYLFEQERYFARAEWNLPNDEKDPDVIQPQLEELAAAVLGEMRAHLPGPEFAQLVAQPQLWFLAARSQAVAE